MTALQIAVIGAGPAGLACARRLADAGVPPVVFEKSRGLGGRCATRLSREGHQFDHGATYVTARGDAFAAYLRAAIRDGRAEKWEPRMAGGSALSDAFVGTPAMSALVAPLAAGLDVRLQTEVQPIVRDGTTWRLRDADDQDLGGFDLVVCTAPPAQAMALVAADPISETIAADVMSPCWTLLAALPAAETPFDACRDDAGDIVWLARDGSKPGREGAVDRWGVHASPGWSAEALELDKDAARDALLPLALGAIGRASEAPVYATAHRWRYALATRAAATPVGESADSSLFLAGDWRLGRRVEDAFDSGRAAADAVLAVV
ncbi:MAG: NAD(P)/FAD-dependent oxidoreductase [Parvularculaceae bacterium]